MNMLQSTLRDWTPEKVRPVSLPPLYWRMVVALVVTVLVMLLVRRGGAQPDSPIGEITPTRITLEFEELTATLEEDEQLVIDYEIERDSWDRFEREEYNLVMLVWVPLDPGLQLYAYPRLRTFWAIDRRDGVLRYPPSVQVNAYDQVTICPIVRRPGMRGGWLCDTPERVRPRSDWGVDIGGDATIRLRRVRDPISWYLPPF